MVSDVLGLIIEEGSKFGVKEIMADGFGRAPVGLNRTFRGDSAFCWYRPVILCSRVCGFGKAAVPTANFLLTYFEPLFIIDLS